MEEREERRYRALKEAVHLFASASEYESPDDQEGGFGADDVLRFARVFEAYLEGGYAHSAAITFERFDEPTPKRDVERELLQLGWHPDQVIEMLRGKREEG